jgi:hypothetical protein
MTFYLKSLVQSLVLPPYVATRVIGMTYQICTTHEQELHKKVKFNSEKFGAYMLGLAGLVQY